MPNASGSKSRDTSTDADAHRAPTPDPTPTCDCTPPAAPEPEPRKTILSRLRRTPHTPKRFSPALTLENAGSVARDHLASERTFLAYVRTSLAIASTGVALVQLFTLSAAASDRSLTGWSRPIGAVVICVGLATLLLGVVRYFTIQSALVQGNFPVARVSTIMLAVVLGVVVVVVFGIIVGVR